MLTAQEILPGKISLDIECVECVYLNGCVKELQTAVAFRYHSQARVVMMRGHGPQASPISLRKEQRRRGALWYAYKRNHGVLHKRYVGKSVALTSARLDEMAVELSRVW